MVRKSDLLRKIDGLLVRVGELERKVKEQADALQEADRKAVLNEKKTRAKISDVNKKVDEIKTKLEGALDSNGELPIGIEQEMSAMLNEWMYGEAKK
ncbi:MAG: hypothetical protein IJ981_03165 [Clostridia bacterium]|nr:hypothetical protein [Clostridia bacterium]